MVPQASDASDAPQDIAGSALVLFSGGQDSATCLAYALTHFQRVETIAFDYSQRHRVELDVRTDFLRRLRADFPHWSDRLGDDCVLSADVLTSLGATAMTESIGIQMQANGLPNTFVPGRNLLFLVLAGALAYRRGIRTLVTGVCETDSSGYPDCRSNTMQAMQQALALGMDCSLRIDTPLMHQDKAQTWAWAVELGGSRLLELITEHTHTCYTGDRSQRHAWGYGCADCPACTLRARGWMRWKGKNA